MQSNEIRDPVEWRLCNLNASQNRKSNFTRSPKISDLKRTNTFIRRLKDYKTESQHAIFSDISTLNLKRYTSECITALVGTIIDGKARVADMDFFGRVCSEMHQCYEGVELELLTCIKKKWELGDILEPTEDSRETQRDRSMIRFICELYRIGVTAEWRIFRWILQKMHSTIPNFERSRDLALSDVEMGESIEKFIIIIGHLNILVRSVGACLFGAEKWPQCSESAVVKDITESFQYGFHSSPVVMEEVSRMVVRFIDTGLVLLEQQNNHLRQIWLKNLKTIKHVGDLPDSLRIQFESKRLCCERMYDLLFPLVETFPSSKRDYSRENFHIRSVPSLEELFAETKQTLGADEKASNMVFLSGLSSFYSVDSSENDVNFYENDEEQRFYENSAQVESKKEQYLKIFSESNEFQCTEPEAIKNVEYHIQTLPGLFKSIQSSSESKNFLEVINSKAAYWTEIFLSDRYSFFKYRSQGDRDQGKSFLLTSKKKLMRYIANMDFPEKFVAMGVCCILNMFYQSGDIDLMDLSERLAKEIEESLFQDIASKLFESSQECAIASHSRFLIEGMKFRFVSPGTVLKILDSLTSKEVMRQHKQIAVILFDCLQGCGGFLAKNPLAVHKFESVLQTTLKSIRALGGELELQLGSLASDLLSRLNCEQGTGMHTTIRRSFKQKVQTYEERYLRHLIYTELNESTVEATTGKIIEMKLESREFRVIAFNVLRKSHRLRFQNIPALAQLIKSLAVAGVDFFAQYIIDDVVERCRQDLECNQSTRSLQKKNRDMAFFVEMYKLGLVHETEFFFVLYMICSHCIAHEATCDYTRIRLIAILLDGLNRGDPKKEQGWPQKFYRLRIFLLHFYELIHLKEQPFPIELNFLLGETLEKMKRCFSLASISLESFPSSLQIARKLLNNAHRKLLFSHDAACLGTNRAFASSEENKIDLVNRLHFFFQSASAARGLYSIHSNAYDGVDGQPVPHSSFVHNNDMDILEDKMAVIYSPDEEKIIDDMEILEETQGVVEDEAHDQHVYPNTSPELPSANCTEAMELDKLLKEMTKESFTSIRQQNSIKAMSGRRVAGSQSMHMVNLRRMTQDRVPSDSIGVFDSEKRTISVAVAVRGKNRTATESQTAIPSDRKFKANSSIDFRVIQIPQDTTMAMQHTANIEKKRLERAEIKRATQSIVNSME